MTSEKKQKIPEIKLRHGIAGTSPAIDQAIEIALKVAPTDLSVLITGENGVGKENIAHIIMENSTRKFKKFISVNCGAIPPGTVDSELFGHKKGAFSGAIENRKGYFEEADGGTLFLDEIGELPLETQVRLLRVLENGEYTPVGASTSSVTNVRIIAATNADLNGKVKEGKFRPDLLYRLNTVPIVLPPLRERSEDIPILVTKFAEDLAEKRQCSSIEFTPEAMTALKAYTWPGNIRQLKHFVENITIVESERKITLETVKSYLQDAPQAGDRYDVTVAQAQPDAGFQYYHEAIISYIHKLEQEVNTLKDAVQNLYIQQHAERPIVPALPEPPAAQIEDTEAVDVTTTAEVEEKRTLDEIERDRYINALEKCNGNRKDAAKELGRSERTVYRKIKEYGL